LENEIIKITYIFKNHSFNKGLLVATLYLYSVLKVGSSIKERGWGG